MIFTLFKKTKNSKLASIKEAGNVFMMLFGAVGMVGVVGASTMTVMKGPVKTMAEVTKRTVAENSMIAAGKLALIASGSQANSDCDGDLILEPLEHGAAITGFTGGGQVPAIVGVGKQDPWGSTYGYCVWDHGITIDDAACGGSSQNRLSGSNAIDQYVIAMVSAGPDGVFDTSCIDYVDSTTPTLNQTSGSDDLVLGYTYAEATAAAAGLWSLSDPDTATIQKDLIVRNDADTADTFALDGDTGNLTLGSGAIGEFPSIRTDYIGAIGTTINVTNPISSDSNIVTTGAITAVTLSGNGAALTSLAGDNIVDGTVDSSEIEDNTLTASDLAVNSVTASEIATGAVGTSEIADGTVTGTDIAANTITAGDIATNGVGASEIAAGAVGTSEIADGTVTGADLAENTITAGDIATNGVSTLEIADGTITGADIAANTITAGNIATNGVGTLEIADGTVTGTDIAANTITAGDIATNGVGALEIGANAVGASEIAASAVGTSEIADNTIVEADISDAFVARNSQLLDGINGASLIRSDAADNVSASTEWQDNQQVRFGNDNDFALYHNGSNMYMRGYKHGAWLYIQGENSSGTNRAMIYANPNNEVRLYYAGAEKLNTSSNGIQVTGNAYASSFLYSSDKRLKENIVSLENQKDKLSTISAYRYNYKADEAKTVKIGVMAQDVIKVYPEAVSTDENGMMAVDYPALVPALIQAVNELSAEVKALKAEQKGSKE